MNEKKNSFIAKIQKNPFLVVLIVVVIGTAIFTVSTLSKAIKDKMAISATTEVAQISTTELKVDSVEKVDNKIPLDGLKRYSETIKKVEAFKEPNKIVFYVEFAENKDLLDAHYATNTYSMDVTPMLCFYIDNGLQVKLPGEFERISTDGLTAVYSFSETADFENAVFLTDNIVTDLSSLLDNQFNLYIEHRTNDGVGKTLAGTYAQTVEQFNQLHPAKPMDINILSDDIKKIETTVCDDFIWVDIYYVDEEAYTKDNADIEKFVVFGFEKGGNKYKRDFIITEYEKLYMTRCVFDKDAMKVLGADMMVDDITVKELFDEYAISVWSTDYTTDKPLFDINGGNDVHDELEEENFGEFEDVDTNELDEVEMN